MNNALRWEIVVFRRQYSVPWPNSLWHLDGHHSLIRWGLVIHGCIDGFSRGILFLKCSNNNLSQTVLELFLKANEKDGFWPSRIRVDYGVENVLVCDAMVEARGEGRGNFIAGPSTRNQRIERLWREVFRCVCHLFYYAWFTSTCYHPPPGIPPGICNFVLTWRSIPHPWARRKRHFPTPGTPHRPQIPCFVYKT